MDDCVIWAIFFAGIVSIKRHPGVPKDKQESMEQMAMCADHMLAIYRDRKEAICRGSSAEPQ